jgi:leukotriene-A4 hydrolase
MSARTLNEEIQGDHRITEVALDIPIPSYLIALAGGNLEYRKIGTNTGVITEPVMIEKCVEELSELQDSLDKAQEFLTEYEWGNYTIIILPPSFPFGGMENPLLTFASPTIIVGDKSQVDVATHEIAHSWTGNLVTNQNWENFWLNEGFTVFTERHVGRIQRGEEFYKISSYLGNSSLFEDMTNFGLDSTFSSLHPDYAGANPYDTFSEVPYEKGFQFLTYLESLIGQEKMQKLLKKYIGKYRRSTVVHTDFKDLWTEFIHNVFEQEEAEEIENSVDWDTWVYTPGAPPVHLNFSTPNLDISRGIADSYIKLGGTGSPENYDEFFGYFSQLKCIFLTELLDQREVVTVNILEQIDRDYDLTNVIDPEQKVLWYQIGILTKYETVVPAADEFLGTVGRLKYLRPLYRALKEYDEAKAVEIFNKHKSMYHPVAVIRIQEILGL